jgi:hypothetical protein
MLKIAIATLLMALLACSSGDTQQDASTTAADLPPVSAVGPGINESATIGDAIDSLTAGAFEIESCLGLVAGREFTNAIQVCLEAAGIAPENTDIQAALKEARAQVAAGAVTAAAEEATREFEIPSLGDAQAPLRTQRVKPPRP